MNQMTHFQTSVNVSIHKIFENVENQGLILTERGLITDGSYQSCDMECLGIFSIIKELGPTAVKMTSSFGPQHMQWKCSD